MAEAIRELEDRIRKLIPESEEAYLLYLADILREPLMVEAIQTLGLKKGSRGIDAGCGMGDISALLAEEIGEEGHVTAIDFSPKLISYASEILKGSRYEKTVTFTEANIINLPFEDDKFDWAWSSDCAGYVSENNPSSLLNEFKRVLKPGGRLAILGWSAQTMLPGYPRLEAALNSAAPYIREVHQGKHFLNALSWFRDAGFENGKGYVFTGSVQAPLREVEKKAVLAFFDMLWAGSKPGVSTKDWAELKKISDSASPEFILNDPGYFAFYSYVMFTATTPK